MTIRGIDISSHQATEDWSTLKANGIAFVAVKRTGGDGYINEDGRAQVAGARSVGIVVIHYLYLGEPGYPNVSGLAQAQYFINEVGDDILPGEGISLDWEENGYPYIEQALACLGALEAHYGFKPSIYTYPSYITEHGLANDARVTAYPLWYASYQTNEPSAPRGWGKLMAWQYSDNETIPGVGHVDGDQFDGTVAELMAYGKPGAVTAATVPSDPAAAIGAALQPTNATGEDVRYYIDAQGVPHIDVAFGGVAARILGVNLADVGISVVDTDGKIEDRSMQNNVFQAWKVRAS